VKSEPPLGRSRAYSGFLPTASAAFTTKALVHSDLDPNGATSPRMLIVDPRCSAAVELLSQALVARAADAARARAA